MLNQVILPREAVLALASAFRHWAVLENGMMDRGAVALQICQARKTPAAVVALKGLCPSLRGG